MYSTSTSHLGPAFRLAQGVHPPSLDHLAASEGPALVAWLVQVMPDQDRADEALQEVWLTLLGGGWSFQPRSSDADADTRAWLRRDPGRWGRAGWWPGGGGHAAAAAPSPRHHAQVHGLSPWRWRRPPCRY